MSKLSNKRFLARDAILKCSGRSLRTNNQSVAYLILNYTHMEDPTNTDGTEKEPTTPPTPPTAKPEEEKV